jgi:type IV pilus assembly protein PilB
MLAKTAALSPEKRKLGRALLAGGAITQEKLQEELDKAGKSQSVLGKALLKANFPREEELLAALVAQIRIPKINVRNTKIPLETIRVVPADVARRFKVLPIERIGDILVIVSPGVGDEDALAAVRKATGCAVFPFQCDAEGFDEVVDGYYDRLAASGLAPAPAPTADSHAAPAPGPTPRPVAAAAPGALAAIPADDGLDEWDRIFAAAGPLPAEEVLL